MREPQRPDVIDQLPGQGPIVQKLAISAAPPGPEVHFIDRHRRMQPILTGSGREPGIIPPGKRVCINQDGGGAWAQLKPAPIGVGFKEEAAALAVTDLELVEGSGGKAWNEEFKNAAGPPASHGVAAPIPAIEITDHTAAFGVRGPDRKKIARDVIDDLGVGAQHVVNMKVLAFTDQVKVVILKLRREGVGVDVRPLDPVLGGPGDGVVLGNRVSVRKAHFEEIGPRDPLKRRAIGCKRGRFDAR